MVEPERIEYRNDNPVGRTASYVLYWMQAAQRVEDNHALWYACDQANRLGLPLSVLFVLADYPSATAVHYRWMLAGLRQVAGFLRSAGISFTIQKGQPQRLVAQAARNAALLVCDRSPCRMAAQARLAIAGALPIPVIEVDGESVIPERVASTKQEWSARTFRNRTAGAIEVYSAALPLALPVPTHADIHSNLATDDLLFDAYAGQTQPAYQGDLSPMQEISAVPGAAAAGAALDRFISERLDAYDANRNDPLPEGTSGLSAYLHFGQISPLAVLRAARDHGGPGYPAFAEQLVVRRELCRNYVHYRPLDYDAWSGLPAWSRATLEAAAADRRSHVYSRAAFESAATHDPYWNAAQTQLIRTGTIHNYMRMYWGKMILAWSADPREAFDTALWLNDRYALDGRDPNGWAGVAWCFGLHDRPWPPRPVFGTVRSMVAAGLRRKFDVDAYARRWQTASWADTARQSTGHELPKQSGLSIIVSGGI
ncbi:MAG TPA: deoxyribodipyrimidine photo-lyase [bacterium]|nr:deoxyribodipyrimidine photo-lyase [bacterium]